ncbi:MAG: enolase C-terminal domain-like protein [Pyramidobacter sp.]|nr:enolase C-terminal domain-like protein [Pyramidobacter sp.]
MRITSIEIIETKIPLPHPYKLSQRYGTMAYTHPTIVKVHTDEGLTGYGETDAWVSFTSETPEGVAVILTHDIAPRLIGEDATNVTKVHENMEYFMRGNHMAKCTIDMAVHDLLGKAANMPVYRVLGGELYDSLPIMGAFGGDTPEEAAANAVIEKNKGYHSLMFKVGRNPVKDAECFLAVRDAVGKGYPIVLDANQGWDLPSAKKFISIAAEGEPVLFEQALVASDIEGMAQLRRYTHIPVSVDESLTDFKAAQEVIRLGAADVFSVKVCKNGGIKEARRIIELAANHNIPILFNSMLEEGITQAASLNIALTTSNLYEFGHAYFSPLRLDADITDYTSLIRDGRVYAPTAPGLGVQLLDDVLDRYIVAKHVVK